MKDMVAAIVESNPETRTHVYGTWALSGMKKAVLGNSQVNILSLIHEDPNLLPQLEGSASEFVAHKAKIRLEVVVNAVVSVLQELQAVKKGLDIEELVYKLHIAKVVSIVYSVPRLYEEQRAEILELIFRDLAEKPCSSPRAVPPIVHDILDRADRAIARSEGYNMHWEMAFRHEFSELQPPAVHPMGVVVEFVQVEQEVAEVEETEINEGGLA